MKVQTQKFTLAEAAALVGLSEQEVRKEDDKVSRFLTWKENLASHPDIMGGL